MKKFLSIAVVIILAAGGWVYYVSNKAQNKYNEILSKIDAIDGIEVKNQSYDKGLASSQASYELVVDERILKKAEIKGPVVFLVKTDIKHGINTVDTHSQAFVKEFENKDEIVKVFGSDLLFTSDSQISLGGDIKNVTRLQDFSFKDDSGSVNLKGLKIYTDLENKSLLSSVKLEVEDFNINFEDSGSLKFDLKDLFYDVRYKDLVNMEAAMKFYKIVPYIGKGGFKNIKFSFCELGEDAVVEFKDGKYNIDADIKDGMFFAEDNGLVKDISINGMKFSDLNLQSGLSNLNVKILEKIFKKFDEAINDSEEELEKRLESDEVKMDLGELMAGNPTYSVTNFSIKNDKGNEAKLKFRLGANGYNKSLNIYENINAVVFDGELKIDVMPTQFLYQIPFIAMFEPALLSQGILQKDGNGVKVEFKFIPQKMDVLINNSIFASQL